MIERAKITDFDHEKTLSDKMVDPASNYPNLGKIELSETNHRHGLEKEHDTEQSSLTTENQSCKQQRTAKISNVGFVDPVATDNQKECEAGPDVGASEKESRSCCGALSLVSMDVTNL